MTLFVVWFSLVMVTVVSGLTFIMPTLVRPTLPLGVSVPHDRLAMPAIATSIRRYQTAVVGAWILGIALTLALFAAFPVAASTVPVFVALGLEMLAYVLARRTIIRAKRDGRWYDDVPVRLRAQITAEPAPIRPPFGWLIAAVVILLVVVAVGVSTYPALADPTPIHWDAAGRPDDYAPKSVWSVFGTPLIGLATVALLFACSLLVRHSPLRAIAGDTAAESARRTTVQHRLLSSMLGQLAAVVAVQLGWLSVAGWLADDGSQVMMTGVIVSFVLMLAVLVIFIIRYRHAVAASITPPRGSRSDAPDDDRHWKGGLIYVNRDDPSVFVAKRFGIGWTVNFGSSGGRAVGLVLALVVAGGTVTAIVTAFTGQPT